MKIGINVKIDVTKIDKNRLFKGEKGIYLDATTFVDVDQLDQYGNNGFIAQQVSKEEREKGVQGPILGNVKVFYKDGGQQDYRGHTGSNQPNPTTQPAQAGGGADFDDDIPFAQFSGIHAV